MRCLTLAAVSGYADAKCQVPIVYAVDDCDPPEIVTQGSGSCGDEQVSYRVGEVVTPAKTYFPSAGGCEEATFGGTGVIYSVEKLPAAMLHFYADAECNTVIAHDPTCREKPLDAVTLLSLDDCNSVLQFAYNEIGDKVDVVRQGYGNDQCVAPSGVFSRFYEIGSKIAPATLPELATVDLGAGRVKARYVYEAAEVPASDFAPISRETE